MLRLLGSLRLRAWLSRLCHALRLRLCPLHLRPLDPGLCLPDLRLHALHLRLCSLRTLSRRRNYPRLSLRGPILRRLSLLSRLHLHLASLLTLRLYLLLRCRGSLLLVRNHLLPRGGPLSLLLLAQGLSLALLLLHFLTHALTLRLLRAEALSALLVNLLPAKLLHLLARVSITASRLARQVYHLSFSRLLCRNVLLLNCRRAILLRLRGRLAFVSELDLLIPRAVGHRLYS